MCAGAVRQRRLPMFSVPALGAVRRCCASALPVSAVHEGVHQLDPRLLLSNRYFVYPLTWVGVRLLAGNCMRVHM